MWKPFCRKGVKLCCLFTGARNRAEQLRQEELFFVILASDALVFHRNFLYQNTTLCFF
jgi:hypothetical protein